MAIKVETELKVSEMNLENVSFRERIFRSADESCLASYCLDAQFASVASVSTTTTPPDDVIGPPRTDKPSHHGPLSPRNVQGLKG